MSGKSIRIAAWSGPRNVSTALMRSWGKRPDTWVTDEPLYAHYLSVNPVNHPGLEEVVAAGETDWQKVAAWLTGPIPEGKPVWYQKHMAHHLMPHIEPNWLESLTHFFLIRDPREMLHSLLAVMGEPLLTDTGLPQQAALFERVRQRTGKVPPVVDARDLLENPRALLAKLCAALGLEFSECMLSWPPGRRETDGIWARHWYANTERSTGFAPYEAKERPLPAALDGLLADCQALYHQLYQHRLTV